MMSSSLQSAYSLIADRSSQKCCLQRKDYQSEMIGMLAQMYHEDSMTDVTLMCDDGTSLKAHRVVLSANSQYFKSVFDKVSNPCQYPVVILKDIAISELKAIIEFIYKGEVMVPQTQLETLLKSAHWLKIKGLVNEENEQKTGDERKRETQGLELGDALGVFGERKRRRKPVMVNDNKRMTNLSHEQSMSSLIAPTRQYLQEHPQLIKKQLPNINMKMKIPNSISNRNSMRGINVTNMNMRDMEVQDEMNMNGNINYEEEEELILPSKLMEQSMMIADDIASNGESSDLEPFDMKQEVSLPPVVNEHFACSSQHLVESNAGASTSDITQSGPCYINELISRKQVQRTPLRLKGFASRKVSSSNISRSKRRRPQLPSGVPKGLIVTLMSEESERISYATQKRFKCELWQNFSRIMLDGEKTNYICCNACRLVLTHTDTSGTNSLRRHRCNI